MSSSAPRTGERMVHQDFIARIRFSNALPPPPHPPKLLDIPNTGLASGQYTTPGFASRLAREQPLNIEADAELGMPLDLVGMPGVFDGDERSIQAPPHPPALHPHDRPLLRPIAALGKHKVAEANVSFLRRTEYISSTVTKRQDGAAPRALLTKANKNRRIPEPAADAPHVIKRKIDKGFDIAEHEFKDPKRAKHPSKRNLKVVDVSPFIPDLEAFPDSGAYVTIKFHQNPVVSTKDYDRRLLSGLFRPIDRTAEEEEAYEAAVAAHEQDPENNPKPQNWMNFDYYLAATPDVGDRFRRKFDVEDADHNDDELYTHDSVNGGCFQYNRLRAYETAQETNYDHETKFDAEVLLAYNEDTFYPNQKAVYYYPVMQKSVIRPQRTKNIARNIGITDEEQVVDQLDVTVEDPREDIREMIKQHRDHPLGTGQADEEEGNEEEHHEGQDAEGEEEGEHHRVSSPAGRRSRSASEEHDAEGEDEE
ncbi:related to DNA-directed RNA polymerase II regulator [Fusarium oxysporum]|uniref:Related to DNA-directed RNA polymerase II regulator n=1 Tax=Fusarium oxysporum TaxID=5507 RepID=A0A2H3T3H3_FUSOX|nr:related to DNA-directed RNA polymerase II regulator [Fusarium oxysporum]